MGDEMVDRLLIQKYNQQVPRYTSYPTIPFWRERLDVNVWETLFSEKFDEQNHRNGISIYIHLPFCESLCTYCGCNKKITTNHSVEEEYLNAIQKEWSIYRGQMKQTPVVSEIHLGGGTPTFFSPQNLTRLLNFISKDIIIHPRHEFSIEGHPNNTTIEHLQALHALGFRRISYGVQDLDPDVQKMINRIQPFNVLKAATKNAREAGFTSVNFDLIYGLPLQTVSSIEDTFGKVLQLMPDRIAFYSYAHVPWTSRGQRLFDTSHLPAPEEKLRMYLKGKELLLKSGYTDIGMDHFSLPTDELCMAWKSGQLHRNFMGYTTHNTGLLLGLGVSAISDTGNGFAQNTKVLHDYYSRLSEGRLPTQKGYVLTARDVSFRKYILDIACKKGTTFIDDDLDVLETKVFPKLTELEKDGLIEWNTKSLKLTRQGHYFMRNVCSAFDLFLNPASKDELFSKAI